MSHTMSEPPVEKKLSLHDIYMFALEWTTLKLQILECLYWTFILFYPFKAIIKSADNEND